MQPELSAQSKWIFENYHYWGQPNATTIVPVISFETKSNLHAELRYNYEEIQTVSLFGGRAFHAGNTFKISVTPLAGISLGKFQGISGGVNADLNWKGLYLSSQSQYSRTTIKEAKSFFFTWSEMGYTIKNKFFGGVALQYTLADKVKEMSHGFLAGINFKNVSIPFYVFNPSRKNMYFVAGFNYELQLKKKPGAGN